MGRRSASCPRTGTLLARAGPASRFSPGKLHCTAWTPPALPREVTRPRSPSVGWVIRFRDRHRRLPSTEILWTDCLICHATKCRVPSHISCTAPTVSRGCGVVITSLPGTPQLKDCFDHLHYAQPELRLAQRFEYGMDWDHLLPPVSTSFKKGGRLPERPPFDSLATVLSHLPAALQGPHPRLTPGSS